MKKETKKEILIAIVILAVVISATVAYNQWQSATIVIDTTPPEIDEDASTHGILAYMDKITVKCVVRENVEMDKVEATLVRISGYLLPFQRPTETITLALSEQSGDVYVYVGTFTMTATRDCTYDLSFTAYDKAGWTDTFQTRITLANVDGYVTVNGIKVDPESTIRLRSRDLVFKVFITSGDSSMIEEIWGDINGEQLPFTYKPYELLGEAPHWEASYTVESDGIYQVTITLRDKAGEEKTLASFVINVGYTEKTWMILIVVGLIIAVGAFAYLNRSKISRKGRKRKK